MVFRSLPPESRFRAILARRGSKGALTELADSSDPGPTEPNDLPTGRRRALSSCGEDVFPEPGIAEIRPIDRNDDLSFEEWRWNMQKQTGETAPRISEQRGEGFWLG